MKLRPWLPLLSVSVLASLGLVVRARSVTPGLPTLPPEGGLTYEARDGDTDALIPCKLTLVGVDGTPDPRFTRNDIGRQEGEGTVVAYDRVLSLAGVGVVARPGRHLRRLRQPRPRVGSRRRAQGAHRGRQVERGAGAAQARRRHIGWLSADFHVHASHSSDSHVPMHDRIYEFVADGVELITSTDHNVVPNYAPVIEEIGAGATSPASSATS